MLRAVLALACVLSLAGAADSVDSVRTRFVYDGKPIHPGIVELFSNWMSDSEDPQVLAVDLSTAQGSNRFPVDDLAADDHGWVRTRRSDPQDHSEFGYRMIGTLPSGTIVLHVYESGGGSGVFESAMLLAVGTEPAIGADGSPRTRHVLHILRTVILGDRANAELRIDGRTVTVDRSHAHAAEMRTPLVVADPQGHAK
jgi:hypothetical protein